MGNIITGNQYTNGCKQTTNKTQEIHQHKSPDRAQRVCNSPPPKEQIPETPKQKTEQKVQEGGGAEVDQGAGWWTRPMGWKRAWRLKWSK